MERLKQEAAFGRAISKFFGQALRRQLDDDFYQRLLEAALEMVQGAQTGSYWLRDEGNRFKAVAAVGFGLEALEGVVLTEEELGREERGLGPRGSVDPDAGEQRRAPAPVGVVRATLSIPVTAHGEVVGFLYLHSFEMGDVFKEGADEFVQLFANELAAMFQHVDLQRTLRKEKGRREQLLAEYKALAEFGAEKVGS